MSDQPFFPPPKPRGDAYRELQERPLTAVEPTADAAPKKPVLVSRADAPLPSVRAKKEAQLDAIIRSPGDERSFWLKTSFVANHPRLTGFLLLLPGAPFTWLTYQAVHTHVGSRGLAIGPLLMGIGFYLLVFGMPIDPATGRPPARWQIGAIVAAVGATVATVVAGFR